MENGLSILILMLLYKIILVPVAMIWAPWLWIMIRFAYFIKLTIIKIGGILLVPARGNYALNGMKMLSGLVLKK